MLLEQFSLYNTQIVITGDLNLHLQDPTMPTTAESRAMIEQFSLIQHGTDPTHWCSNWLNVILTHDDCVFMTHHSILMDRSVVGEKHLDQEIKMLSE